MTKEVRGLVGKVARVSTPLFCASKSFWLYLRVHLRKMHKAIDSPKLISVGSGRVWFMGHLLYWLRPLCCEIKASSPPAQHVVRICIQHFIIKDFSAGWHPKCWSPSSEWCILEQRNCNFCIIYVLGVWYANSEHYYFLPHDIWLLSSQRYTIPADRDHPWHCQEKKGNFYFVVCW